MKDLIQQSFEALPPADPAEGDREKARAVWQRARIAGLIAENRSIRRLGFAADTFAVLGIDTVAALLASATGASLLVTLATLATAHAAALLSFRPS